MTAKLSKGQVLRKVFPDLNITTLKTLSEEDRTQLASAAARELGLKPEEVAFELVEY